MLIAWSSIIVNLKGCLEKLNHKSLSGFTLSFSFETVYRVKYSFVKTVHSSMRRFINFTAKYFPFNFFFWV